MITGRRMQLWSTPAPLLRTPKQSLSRFVALLMKLLCSRRLQTVGSHITGNNGGCGAQKGRQSADGSRDGLPGTAILISACRPALLILLCISLCIGIKNSLVAAESLPEADLVMGFQTYSNFSSSMHALLGMEASSTERVQVFSTFVDWPKIAL